MPIQEIFEPFSQLIGNPSMPYSSVYLKLSECISVVVNGKPDYGNLLINMLSKF